MNNLLPIGSVIILRNVEGHIMIIGYYGTDQNEKIKEYIACNYPRGMCTKKRFYFNG